MNSRYFSLVCLLFAIGLGGCSPASQEDYYREGRRLTQVLIDQLQSVQSHEQLLAIESDLKNAFDSLVALMIQSREFQDQQGEGAFEEASEESALLKEALLRVYAIEGGRELIEKTEQEALIRLDAYERQRMKKRDLIHK